MKKQLIVSFLILALLCGVYAVSYLYLRKAKVYTREGYWVIYLYDRDYVRQYAVDRQAQLLFKNAINNDNKSFFAGYEGDIGDNWFCVYRKPDTKWYRLFRVAEEIENRIR